MWWHGLERVHSLRSSCLHHFRNFLANNFNSLASLANRNLRRGTTNVFDFFLVGRGFRSRGLILGVFSSAFKRRKGLVHARVHRGPLDVYNYYAIIQSLETACKRLRARISMPFPQTFYVAAKFLWASGLSSYSALPQPSEARQKNILKIWCMPSSD